jgi:D-alanyl-D-alanine endopeptidase (penicillin-binding protein 7)
LNKKAGVIFTVLLCVAIILFPVSSGLSKQPVGSASLQNNSFDEAGRVSGKLILRSSSVLVKDQQTGELLVEKRAQAVMPIASITKLMTAMVVLDANLDLLEQLTIESADVDTVRHSRSGLRVKTNLTRRDALLLALMASDNRAAHALGRTYQGGFASCVAAMNTKAKLLGLNDTHFEDTIGLSSGNVSSARDLARLVEVAYCYPLIREFTTCNKAVIQSGRRNLQFHNTNHLVKNPHWQIGLSKTGFTSEAGRCLVMQAKVADRPVLIVLLDAQGRLTRFGDANRIKNWLEGTLLLSSMPGMKESRKKELKHS